MYIWDIIWLLNQLRVSSSIRNLNRWQASQGDREQPQDQLPEAAEAPEDVRGGQVSAQQHHRPTRIGRDRDRPVPGVVGRQQGPEVEREEPEVFASAQPEAGGPQEQEVELGNLPERSDRHVDDLTKRNYKTAGLTWGLYYKNYDGVIATAYRRSTIEEL